MRLEPDGRAADAAGMECRAGCGACCIAPSISSPLPGRPQGKPAGMPCPSLTADYRCSIYGDEARPAVCSTLGPEPAMCGASRAEALATLAEWERLTRPC